MNRIYGIGPRICRDAPAGRLYGFGRGMEIYLPKTTTMNSSLVGVKNPLLM